MQDDYFVSENDSFGYDYCYKPQLNLLELMDICNNDINIIAFNTLGFMKNRLIKLEKSVYFKNEHKLYIRKDRVNESNCDPELLKIILDDYYMNDIVIPPIYMVNLKQRPDRLEKMRNIFDKEGLHINKFEAVDGRKLVPTASLMSLFEGNDFGTRSTFLGCALSHLKLWNMLCDDNNLENIIIAEDDITLQSDFKYKLKKSIKLINERLDTTKPYLVFLSIIQWKEYITDLFEHDCKFTEQEMIKFESKFYLGGTHMYILNKKAAYFLREHAYNNGIKNGIDRFMQYTFEMIPEIQVYMSVPFLCKVQHPQMIIVDSDIQYNYNKPDNKLVVLIECDDTTLNDIKAFFKDSEQYNLLIEKYIDQSSIDQYKNNELATVIFNNFTHDYGFIRILINDLCTLYDKKIECFQK